MRTENTSNLKPKTKGSNIIIVLLFVLSILTGIVPQSILSIGVVLCCVFLCVTKDLQLAFPFILFYNVLYGKVFGLSVLRIYSILLLLKVLFNLSQKPQRLKIAYLIPVGVCGSFLLLTISQYSLQSAIFTFIDVLMSLFLVLYMCEEEGEVKKFFSIFSLVTLCSFLSGIICDVTMAEITPDLFKIVRFSGTLEDPNYFGFFANIAIFSIIALRLFSRPVRRLIVILLYVVMLSSVSITAIVVNIIAWIIYLLVTKQIKIKTIIIIACVFLVLINVYSYGLKNHDVPIIGAMSNRINEKITSFYLRDYNSVTTGRIDLTKSNWSYYKSLPLINLLFGGVSVNYMFIDNALIGASHNEYVDLFLNVGVIGWLLMVGFLFWRIFTLYREYIESKSNVKLYFLICKVIWSIYAFSLTLFLDYRFLIFFLM